MRTVSSLPSFAHPKRTYGTAIIVYALALYYLETKRVKDVVRSSFFVCSRQLLLWFRKRIEENVEWLLVAFLEGLQLRAPPLPECNKEGAVRQILKTIQGYQPERVSLDLFAQTGRSYLTKTTL
jgi:hypothetical protein